MNANNNNNKKTQAKKQAKKCLNPFSFGISDDFYDPFDKDILDSKIECLKNSEISSLISVLMKIQ